MKQIALFLITLYQKTISLDQGPLKFLGIRVCKFEPTCSEYLAEAIKKYGIFKGLWLGFRRILRCHPWSQGGIDPVI